MSKTDKELTYLHEEGHAIIYSHNLDQVVSDEVVELIVEGYAQHHHKTRYGKK
jgi:hypothetical protein